MKNIYIIIYFPFSPSASLSRPYLYHPRLKLPSQKMKRERERDSLDLLYVYRLGFFFWFGLVLQ